MLWEILQSWRTPVFAPFVKKMGYLHEAIAMVARAKRCEPSWQAHYNECQAVISQAVAQSKQHRKVLIFGAGTLNDIPLAELSCAFKAVILVDLVFLSSARAQAKSLPNVDLIEHDVTQSLAEIFTGRLNVTQPSKWLDDPEIDLVISLNLITQLPLIPVRWLLNTQKVSEIKAHRIAQQLIQQHLEYLQAFQGLVCLIADRENIEIHQQSGKPEVMDPWWELEPPPIQRSWPWLVVPRGERSRHISQTNTVGVSWFND